jgi:glutathione S-transferase
METFDLFSATLCPYVHRVRIVISEKKLPVNLIHVDLDNKPADFLDVSPDGAVPVLRHGACNVRDSTVINEYLEDAFPAVAMMPSEPAARAAAREWIRFADVRLYQHTSQLLHSEDPDVHARSLTAIKQDLLLLEKRVSASQTFDKSQDGSDSDPYWMGPAFTLVDAAFYPWFEQFEVLQAFFGLRWPDDCKRLARWREAVAMRSSVAAIARPAEFYLQRYRALHEARSARRG